ncbi:MAG: DUF302 domain-containing protein [Candidatus Thiodiazotropha sp.]
MRKFFMMTLASLWMFVNPVQADSGLVNVASQHDVSTTADRFVAAVEQAGLKVFSRIDHATGAAKVGETLRPTQLIIFGSPKVGTALMSADQRVGIDLPLKALVWQDAEQKVWVSYNSPDYLFGRFSIEGRDPVKQKITQALAKFAAAAAE